MIKSALPDGANLPYIFKFNTQDIPILILSVQSEESTDALYKILDDKVVSKLSRIKEWALFLFRGLTNVKYRYIAILIN